MLGIHTDTVIWFVNCRLNQVCQHQKIKWRKGIHVEKIFTQVWIKTLQECDLGGFGPCLGISHPTHPHLGEISNKQNVFFFWGGGGFPYIVFFSYFSDQPSGCPCPGAISLPPIICHFLTLNGSITKIWKILCHQKCPIQIYSRRGFIWSGQNYKTQ